MKRALAASAGLLLLWGCRGGVHAPTELDPCANAPALALAVPQTVVHVEDSFNLSASGGTGPEHLQFGMDGEDAGAPPTSGGEVAGSRYRAGTDAGTDVIWVVDRQCHVRTETPVTVLPAYDLAPSEIVVAPRFAFTFQPQGLFDAGLFGMEVNATGASLTPAGRYTAGGDAGTDVVRLLDTGSQRSLYATVQVKPGATFRAAPPLLAAPSGGWVSLQAEDGSDRVTWSHTSGPGTLQGDTLSFADGVTGVAQLTATDPFLNRTATARVRVLDELIRTSVPHGRLTDFSVVVAGDFDGDGAQEIAIGVPESDLGASQGGAVFIFKDTPGGLAEVPEWRIVGTTITASLGAALAVGDFDGDRKVDLAVGAPGADITVADSGAVYLYRFTPLGPQLIRPGLTGLGGRGRFGSAVAAADVDGDGMTDLVVGSPNADLAVAANQRGVLDVFLNQPQKGLPTAAQVRLSGWDQRNDGGTLAANPNLHFGSALSVADFNDDGRLDVAALGTITSAVIDGGRVNGSQFGIEVFLGRPLSVTGNPYQDKPDMVIATTVPGDLFAGAWRALGFIPRGDGHPPLLVGTGELMSSPDLRDAGGNAATAFSGGVAVWDLTSLSAAAEAPADPPPQLTRDDAYARYNSSDTLSFAGRSWGVADVDGAPGAELLVGAPQAPNSGASRLQGRIYAFPLTGVGPGSLFNKPLATLAGSAAAQSLGAGLGVFEGGMVAVASRTSPPGMATFNGSAERLRPGGSDFSGWTRQSSYFAARPADEQFGIALAGGRSGTGAPTALVGSPGWPGPGNLNDGNDLRAGRAWTFNLAAAGGFTSPGIITTGAASPVISGGREMGVEVAFTDFNGDGMQDMVIGSPNLQIPGTNSRATDITPHYTAEVAACLPGTSASTTGGVQVMLGMADGSWRPAYRLWAVPAISGCTGSNCTRSQIGRSVTGGFDFNGDGTQDIAATRNTGMEIFLGRPPTDPSPTARLTMACDSAWTATFLSNTGAATGTGSVTPLGDLDGDGCDDLAVRTSPFLQTSFSFVFGFDATGAHCAGHTQPAWIRLADRELGLAGLGLGVTFARAGRFLSDGRDLVAASASSFIVGGTAQDAILLYDVAAIAARRPASGELLLPAYGGGLEPTPLTFPTRITGLGRALAGNIDLTGDGKPELIVGAPGASFTSDGAGAVLVLLGGGSATAPVEYLRIVGDPRERSNFGSALGLIRPGATGPEIILGAFTSFRTGTQNGTAFRLPLGF
ncbi:MAG TPA: VCBS repeat-containing protein [Myxococcaceae bacterium]